VFIHIDIKILPKIKNKRRSNRQDNKSGILKDKKDVNRSSEFLENIINYFPFEIKKKILTNN